MIAIAIIISALSILSACGSSSDDSSGSSGPPSDAIKLDLFGGSIYFDDELYQLSCNPLFVSFLIDEFSPGCVAVVVKTGMNDSRDRTWSISTPADGIIYNAIEADETLTIDGKAYHCLLYSGGWAHKTSGESSPLSSHLIISSSAATKPSDLNASDVLFMGINHQDLCEGFYFEP